LKKFLDKPARPVYTNINYFFEVFPMRTLPVTQFMFTGSAFFGRGD